MSNKLRVLLIEADASDEGVQQILKGMLAAIQPVPTGPKEQIVALVDGPRILSAPKAEALKAVSNGHPEVKPAKAPPPVINGAAGSSREQILSALAGKPMTSNEVHLKTGLPKSTVYSMLNILRGEGLVEARAAEDSIYPRNHLVKK